MKTLKQVLVKTPSIKILIKSKVFSKLQNIPQEPSLSTFLQNFFKDLLKEVLKHKKLSTWTSPQLHNYAYPTVSSITRFSSWISTSSQEWWIDLCFSIETMSHWYCCVSLISHGHDLIITLMRILIVLINCDLVQRNHTLA